MEIFLQHLDLFLFLILVIVGYSAGTLAEKRHYRSIMKRESELMKMAVVTAEGSFPPERIKQAILVSGNAVISIDYFKRLLAVLRNIFGGRVKAYESLLDRARREAILRMKDDARKLGANMVINMRMETSTIGKNANRKKQLGSVEVVAYGTAVVLTRK